MTKLWLLPPANEVCEGYVFTAVCLSTGGGLGHCPGVFCPGGRSLSRGISVQGGLCPGRGFCPGGSLFRKVSVQGVSVQVVSVLGGLCPGGSLSRGVPVQGGGLCPGRGLSLGISVRGEGRRGGLCLGGSGGTHPTGMHCCFVLTFL